MIHRIRSTRRGISLLEIVLSIGIMGASLAVLSTIVLNGSDAALDAKDRAIAQMLCEQQIAQTLLNNVTPIPYVDQPLNTPDASSTYTATLQTQQGQIQGILLLSMTVKGTSSDSTRDPVAVTLTRMMVDPALGLEQLEADEKAAAEEEAAAAEAASSGSI